MSDLKSKFIDVQKLRFSRGLIGRRDFIRSVVATGMAAPAALSLAGQVQAQTPSRGGTYRLGLGHGSTTDSLDPATYENDFTTTVGYSYGNNLTEVSPAGDLIPELAEVVEPRNGGASWAFKLRSGVEFHNGKSLTPEDVIATFNYHRNEDSTSAAKGLLTSVTDVRKDGNDTVVFDLTEANADFPFIVSDYHLLILPSAPDGSLDPTAGVGTGGYVTQVFEPGVRYEGTRNPNYFKEGAAHFDAIQLLSLIDTTARQNALLSGQVDMIDRIDPKTVALISRAPNIEILEATGYLHYTFPMRLDTPPFDNYDLRMALKLAIKRQEMVDKILLGHGAVGNDHPISPAVPFHAASLPQREFDPERAAAHYKKSGHSGPIQLSASDAAFSGAVDAAQLIQASAAEAGIDIEVVREPSDGYWSNVWNKKGWCACYWSGRPTQDWMYSSAYVDSTEWNDTAWVGTDGSKRFNELVVAARAELDQAKREAMYFEAQQLISDDGGAIVPMFANYIMGHGKNLAHGPDIAANWANDGNKSHERWWFTG
jgi:peptide/nickel transport system substrate-binding protein